MSVDMDSIEELLETSSEEESSEVGSQDLEGLNKKLEEAEKRAGIVLAKLGATSDGSDTSDVPDEKLSWQRIPLTAASAKSMSERNNRTTPPSRMSVLSPLGRSSRISPGQKRTPSVRIPQPVKRSPVSPAKKKTKEQLPADDGSDSTDDLSKIIQRKSMENAAAASSSSATSSSGSGSNSGSSSGSGSSSSPGASTSVDSSSEMPSNKAKQKKTPPKAPVVAPPTPSSPKKPSSDRGHSVRSRSTGSEHRVSFDKKFVAGNNNDGDDDDDDESSSYESYETEEEDDDESYETDSSSLEDEETYETDTTAPEEEGIPDVVIPVPPDDGQLHRFHVEGNHVIEEASMDLNDALSPRRSKRSTRTARSSVPHESWKGPDDNEREAPRGWRRTSPRDVNKESWKGPVDKDRETQRGSRRTPHMEVNNMESWKGPVDRERESPGRSRRTSTSGRMDSDLVSPRGRGRHSHLNAIDESSSEPADMPYVSPRRRTRRKSSGDDRPVDMELAPPRGARRKPYSDVPVGIAVERRNAHPVKEKRRRRHDQSDQVWTTEGDGFTTKKPVKKHRGFFDRLFGYVSSDGESYGRPIWEPRRYNDDVSQISDPLKPRRRQQPIELPKITVTSSEYVQPGSRALRYQPAPRVLPADLESVSSAPPTVTSDMQRLEEIRRQKRDNRFALAGLPPSSTRRYYPTYHRPEQLVPAKAVPAKLVLAMPVPARLVPAMPVPAKSVPAKPVPASMQPTPTMRHVPYALDEHESDTGSRTSKKTTGTSLLRRLWHQQTQIMSILKGLALPDQDQPRPTIQYQNELPKVIEDRQEESIARPMTAYIPDEETFEKEVVESDHPQLPMWLFDDYSRTTEDPLWGHRSLRFCLTAFLALGLLGLGLWMLIALVISDDSPSLPVATRTPGPTPPPAFSPSPTGLTLSPHPTVTIPAPTTKPTTSQERVVSLVLTLLADVQSLNDPHSAQSRALDWVSADDKLPSYDDVRVLTRFTLAMFYYSTDGDKWNFNDGWLSDSHECTWYSKVDSPCDTESRRFSRLALGDNNIGGSLPADLAILSDLTAVNLGGTITGSLPSEYGAMTKLKEMRVSGKTIGSTIPSEYSMMTSLTTLDLSQNQLSGTIPEGIGRDLKLLERLDLHENTLVGSIPSEISNLGRLQELTLRDNEFEGAIPKGISALAKLLILDLDSNRFSSLPHDIGLLLNLRILSVSNNNLGGTLPTSLGDLKSLISLRLNTNALTGTIPSEIGLITGLSDLIVRDNRLSGTVSSYLGGIRTLVTLRLDGNDLTGSFPTSVCQSFDMAESSFFADCGGPDGGNVEIDCPCCNFCCSDETGDCFCQLEESNPILCIP